MKEKLAKLINVKSIITISLTSVFAYLSITNKVPQELNSIYTMIIGFYFGTQTQKGE